MSKLYVILFAILASFIVSSKLKLKSKCIAKGGDCDLTSYCCSNLVCKDFRCSVKGTKDNQVKWHKKGGDKCDWFHHCKKGYKCQSHRCNKTEDYNEALEEQEEKVKAEKKAEEEKTLIQKLVDFKTEEDNTNTLQTINQKI